ncbi:MAG: hypothetical protein WAW85_15880 [Gordonia sp. (in: high G+C Gram-positive bacteria)]|uniref:hypothetical protein n=1 Tax=Gordonia sp. (in: high G+C Gram-positive bacteria) TaxID=84139 RepID=UPI003BB6E39E
MNQPHYVLGCDLAVGDRIVAFTPDADALITDIEVLTEGNGRLLGLDIYERRDGGFLGPTLFIARPDIEYAVDRRRQELPDAH